MSTARVRSSQSARNVPALLLGLTLFTLPLLVNVAVSLSYDDVFLIPKLWWTLGAILPSAAYLLWNNRRGLSYGLSALTGFWLLWCLLGFLSGVRPELAWHGLPGRLESFPVYLTYATTLLATFAWARREQLKAQRWATALSFVALPLGLYAAAQYYGLATIPGGLKDVGVAATDVGVTMGHRGYFAGLLALMLPLAAQATKWTRWGYVLVILVVFSFVASLSRGPILAGLAAYLYWVIVGRHYRAWGVHLALLLGALAPLPHLTPHQLSLRVLGNNGQAIADNSDRTVLWNSALNGIREHPLLGWGQGQLVNIMATRPDSALLAEKNIETITQRAVRLPWATDQALRWRISSPGQPEQIITHNIYTVHNEYLEYALNFGIPAALAYLALLGLAIWRGRHVAWAGAAALAYAVYVFTWPETLRFAPIAWALLGVALAGIPQAARPKSATLPA